MVSLVLAVRVTDIRQTRLALSQTDYFPLVPAIMSLGLTLGTKATRWKLLMSPKHSCLPVGRVFSAFVIGQMVNTLFPVRVGEVARAYFVGEMAGPSKTLAFATIVIEKAMDMVAAALLAALLFLVMPLPQWLQWPGAGLAFAAFALMLTLFFFSYERRCLSRLIARSAGVLPRLLRPTLLEGQIEKFLDGLEAVRSARTLLLAGILTCLAWVSSAATNYFVFLAAGLDLPLAAPALLLVILQMGIAIPSGLGRIGVFQYLTILALSLFAVGSDRALAAGVILYVLVYVPPVLLGLFYLWRYHLGLWQAKTLAVGS